MDDMKPLVSIGMPVYNGEKYIRQALDSLLAQDYGHFELIISDNASTDGTPEICREYAARDSRIAYYRNQENMGAAWNFKRVLDLAAGEYFMWLPHDYRLLDANYLSTLINGIGNCILIFPLFILSSMGEIESVSFFDIYRKLGKKGNYLDAWCMNGSGYPIYGLYNRRRLIDGNYLELLLKCNDWIYFNEGLFLHKLFIDGLVAYCPDIKSFVETSSTSLAASKEDLIGAFCRYSFETARLFQSADLEESRKNEIFEILIKKHSNFYVSYLGSSIKSAEAEIKLSPYRRLRTAARVLVKGR